MSDAESKNADVVHQARVRELDRYLERGGTCLLRYEDFVDNPRSFSKRSRRLSEFWSIRKKLKSLCESIRCEKNREVARRLRGFKEVDSETQIHGDHIYQAEVAGWRKFVMGSHGGTA